MTSHDSPHPNGDWISSQVQPSAPSNDPYYHQYNQQYNQHYWISSQVQPSAPSNDPYYHQYNQQYNQHYYPPQTYQLAPQDPVIAGSTPVDAANGDPSPDYDAETEDGHPDNWAGDSFSDKKIRMGFIRKVYLILMIQLTFTVSMICLFLFCTPIKHWIWQNSWFYYVSYGVFVVTLILLVCVPGVRRRVPLNYVCLAIFTMAMTYMTATISSYYDTEIVLICMGITAALCLAISLFAIQTKIDFTACAGAIYALCVVLFLFGLACLITYLVVQDDFANYVMNCVYGGLAALVFSLFLVLDTQMVVGGKNKKVVLSPEEYISGALQLYLDIVYLFWILISLMKG